MWLIKFQKSFGGHLRAGMYAMAAVFVIGMFFLYGGSRGRSQPEQARASDVVATVGKHNITQEALLTRCQQVIKGQQETNPQFRPPSFGQELAFRLGILEGMRWEIIQDEEAAKAEKEGVRVSSRDVKAAIALRVEMQVAMTDRKEVAAAMRRMGIDNVEEYKERLANSFSDAQRAAERQGLLLEGLQKKVQERAVPSLNDDQLKAQYSQAHLYHILIAGEGVDPQAARKKAEEVLGRAKAGEDYAKLAKEFSQDTATKDSGGDLGFADIVSPLPKPVIQAALAFQVGQPPILVESERGFHIIRVTERKDNLPKDFDQKKEDYRRQQLQGLRDEAWREYGEKVDKEYVLTLRDPALRAMQMQATNPDEAIALWQKALQEPGQDEAPIRYHLATLLKSKGQLDEAIKVLDAALEVAGDQPEVLELLGELNYEKGNVEVALQHLARASEEAVGDPDIHTGLAALYRKMKRSDLAEKEEEWVRKWNEEHPPEYPAVPGFPFGSVPGG